MITPFQHSSPRLLLLKELFYHQNRNRSTLNRSQKFFYFTNTDNMKRDDPYAQLGLSYGDGATSSEIKAAFRAQAAKLHPDVNKTDSPEDALRKFQDLQKAYNSLMKFNNDPTLLNEKEDEWRFAIWRNGDRIAMDRKDVAGVMRKRPIQPATKSKAFAGAVLGHPCGTGTSRAGDLLGPGEANPQPVSGRSANNLARKKVYQPWDGRAGARASR